MATSHLRIALTNGKISGVTLCVLMAVSLLTIYPVEILRLNVRSMVSGMESLPIVNVSSALPLFIKGDGVF